MLKKNIIEGKTVYGLELTRKQFKILSTILHPLQMVVLSLFVFCQNNFNKMPSSLKALAIRLGQLNTLLQSFKIMSTPQSLQGMSISKGLYLLAKEKDFTERLNKYFRLHEIGHCLNDHTYKLNHCFLKFGINSILYKIYVISCEVEADDFAFRRMPSIRNLATGEVKEFYSHAKSFGLAYVGAGIPQVGLPAEAYTQLLETKLSGLDINKYAVAPLIVVKYELEYIEDIRRIDEMFEDVE